MPRTRGKVWERGVLEGQERAVLALKLATNCWPRPLAKTTLGDEKLADEINAVVADFARFIEANLTLPPITRRRRKPPATEEEAVQ